MEVRTAGEELGETTGVEGRGVEEELKRNVRNDRKISFSMASFRSWRVDPFLDRRPRGYMDGGGCAYHFWHSVTVEVSRGRVTVYWPPVMVMWPGYRKDVRLMFQVDWVR